MKTKIAILTLIGTITVLVSCQKEKIKDAPVKQSTLKEAGCPPEYTILNMLNPQFLWCKVPGCNCAGWVVIKGGSSIYDNFVTTVESNSGSAVAQFFSQSNYSIWSALFPYLVTDTGMLAKLQSGNYTIAKVQISDSNDFIFVVRNNDNSDYFGMPVTKE
jgi:hypothetical protein